MKNIGLHYPPITMFLSPSLTFFFSRRQSTQTVAVQKDRNGVYKNYTIAYFVGKDT